MTLLEAIKCGVSNFPIPKQTIEMVALARGVAINDVATVEILQSKEYRLMEADVKMWIALSANISQGDISVDNLVTTKELFKAQANAVYNNLYY